MVILLDVRPTPAHLPQLLVSVFLALPYDQAEEIAADDNDLLPLTGFDDLPSIERESHSQPGDEVDISYREFLNVRSFIHLRLVLTFSRSF